MRTVLLCIIAALHPLALLAGEEGFHAYKMTGSGHDTPLIPGSEYRVHQADRPQPPRVIPGAYAEQSSASAPADAIILFDGTSLDAFTETNWKIVDGNVVAAKGNLQTKEAYGDCQLHLEWRTPDPALSAERLSNMGNSGIKFMWRYELQVFDSYSCRIYADGSAGAIYGQTPPMVNVCRKPGEWQTFDVYFIAPVYEGDTLVKPARMTVWHNGVIIQNDTEILGKTMHKKVPDTTPHPARQPLAFQGHGSPVEYRNIWIRDLGK